MTIREWMKEASETMQQNDCYTESLRYNYNVILTNFHDKVLEELDEAMKESILPRGDDDG